MLVVECAQFFPNRPDYRHKQRHRFRGVWYEEGMSSASADRRVQFNTEQATMLVRVHTSKAFPSYHLPTYAKCIPASPPLAIRGCQFKPGSNKFKSH